MHNNLTIEIEFLVNSLQSNSYTASAELRQQNSKGCLQNALGLQDSTRNTPFAVAAVIGLPMPNHEFQMKADIYADRTYHPPAIVSHSAETHKGKSSSIPDAKLCLDEKNDHQRRLSENIDKNFLLCDQQKDKSRVDYNFKVQSQWSSTPCILTESSINAMRLHHAYKNHYPRQAGQLKLLKGRPMTTINLSHKPNT